MAALNIQDTVMELTVDGVEVPFDSAGIVTFKDLIDHMEKVHVVLPRVITRVVLNGEEIDEGQEVGLGGFSVNEIVSLAIESADQLHLAHESLTDAQEYLPAISDILEAASRMIRSGNVDEGLQTTSEALRIIGDFGQVLEAIRITFQIDYSKVRIDDLTLLDKLNDLGNFARQILRAAEKEDWTAFADIMEYELSPLLYEWMAVIPSLIELLPNTEDSDQEETSEGEGGPGEEGDVAPG